MVGDSDI